MNSRSSQISVLRTAEFFPSVRDSGISPAGQGLAFMMNQPQHNLVMPSPFRTGPLPTRDDFLFPGGCAQLLASAHQARGVSRSRPRTYTRDVIFLTSAREHQSFLRLLDGLYIRPEQAREALLCAASRSDRGFRSVNATTVLQAEWRQRPEESGTHSRSVLSIYKLLCLHGS